MSGASVRITFELVNIDLAHIAEDVLADLNATYTRVLSQALSLEGSKLKDLYGNANSVSVEASRVAGASGAKVSTFTEVPAGSSAKAMAAQLYTDSFRSQIVDSTIAVLDHQGMQNVITWHLRAPMVSVKPEHFTPLRPTTTMTTTTATSTSTTALPESTGTSTVQHDLSEETTPGFLGTAASTSQEIPAGKSGTKPNQQLGQLMLALLIIAGGRL